jgi:tetratricopeptide (TPR) repeat protein
MTSRDPHAMKVRRAWLYSAGAAVAATLAYVGFIMPSNEADPGTMIAIADLDLKVASTLSPHVQKKPEILELQRQHLQKARSRLDAVERAHPGLTITREYRAYASALEHDYSAAAQWYREALATQNIEPSKRIELRLNLSRVLLEVGDTAAANEQLDQVESSARDSAWWLVRAHVCDRSGDIAKRSEALQAAFAAANADEAKIKIIAETASDLGDDIGITCYEALEKKSAIDWYRLAKLKVRAGQFDTATEALVRVRQSKPELLQKLMSAEEAFWSRYEGEGFHRMESRTTEAARPDR